LIFRAIPRLRIPDKWNPVWATGKRFAIVGERLSPRSGPARRSCLHLFRRLLLGSWAHEFCPIGMSREAVGSQVIDPLEEGGHGLAMLLLASSSKSSFQFAERNERHRQYKKNTPGLVRLRSQISRIAAAVHPGRTLPTYPSFQTRHRRFQHCIRWDSTGYQGRSLG